MMQEEDDSGKDQHAIGKEGGSSSLETNSEGGSWVGVKRKRDGGGSSPSMDDESTSSHDKQPHDDDDDDDDESLYYQVIVVGAGAAGIGIAAALIYGCMDPAKLLIVEKGPCVGSSFCEWHTFTHFISPSWPSHPFGPQDLNTIFPDTSVGISQQHPTGTQYASYLEGVAKNFNMNIRCNQNVTRIEYDQDKKRARFSVHVQGRATLQASCVVWCGGEWSNPSIKPTSILTNETNQQQHNIVHYKDLVLEEFTSCGNNKKKDDDDDDKVVIVGLGEAGVDTACALAQKGISVVVIDEKNPEDDDRPQSKDPSCLLSPRSLEGLQRYQDKIEILRGQKCVDVTCVSDSSSSAYRLLNVQLASSSTRKNSDNDATTIRSLKTSSKVIFCTGFDVQQNPVIRDLFHWREDGYPEVEATCDESTKTPNLFLAGPMLRHDVRSGACSNGAKEGDKEEEQSLSSLCQTAVFCFVYKFRTRFPVVAEEVSYRIINEMHEKNDGGTLDRTGQMWGAAVEAMRNFYQSKGMYLADITTAACTTCV